MQNLVIYKFSSLYDIFNEISLGFNFKIYYIDDENNLNDKLKVLKNCLVLSDKNYFDINNFIVLHDLPINIFKLIEKINTEFLKKQYKKQSKINLNNYTIDLNSREIFSKTKKVKLTEKEIDTIIYLSKANKPVSIDDLQEKIWNYQNEVETHTVETHIYRLRKKFLDIFNDNKFIVSEKNGYLIK